MAGFARQLSRGIHVGWSPGRARFWIPSRARSRVPGIPAGVKGWHSIAASGSVGTISTVLASRTVAGDLGLAIHAYNPATEESPTPGGWAVVDTLNISATAHVRVYKKVLTLAEAGTNLTFTNSTLQRLAAGCLVLDGTVYGDVDVFLGVTDLTSRKNHTSPTTVVRTVPGIEVVFFGMRSSTPSVAITAPPSCALLTQAFGVGSGSTAVAIGINGARVTNGVPAGGGDWIETLANGSSAMWTLAVSTIEPAGPGGTVAVDPATEVDTATALVEAKAKPVAQGTETGTASALLARKARIIGQAAATNTAGVITPVTSGHIIAVGQATETDTATTVARRKAKAVSGAVETDTGTPVTLRKVKPVQAATEADTATALAKAKRRTLAQASETDTATATVRRKLRTVAQAAELDTAGAVVRPGQVGRATETETATALVRRKTRAVGQATETDTGGGAWLRRKVRAVAQAAELDTATALFKRKLKTLLQATETETATLPVRRKTLVVAKGTELDTAGELTGLGRFVAVGRATETDTAYAITYRLVTPRPAGAVTTVPDLGSVTRPGGATTLPDASTVTPRPAGATTPQP